MRLLFIINTPAQAYTWKYIIQKLIKENQSVHIIAREYGSTTGLLDSFGFSYQTFKPVGSKTGRILGTVNHLQSVYNLSHKFNPSLVIGFGVDAALTAFRLRRPSIVFNDSEPIGIQNTVNKLFATTIVTPSCFKLNLGKKQVRVNSYKELAYLHPDYFTPDPSIFNELNIPPGTGYAVLRFNVFDAIHDIGRKGFTVEDQLRLVKDLLKYTRVFISPEGNLDPGLEKYHLTCSTERIHHVLYYSSLFVTDTQTMATEAAILGTPVVRCNNFVSPHDMGNFVELENKYGMMYSLRKTSDAVEKAESLIQNTDLKKQWSIKRQNLLNDKTNFTKFFLNVIDDYSQGKDR